MLNLHGHSYLLPTSKMRVPAEKVNKKKFLKWKADEYMLFSCFNVGMIIIAHGVNSRFFKKISLFCLPLVFPFYAVTPNKQSPPPHMYESSCCTVTCNMLLPLGARCSLACVVWPRCCRSSLGLWGGVCLLFVSLSLMNGNPLKPNTAFSSLQDPCCHQAIYHKHSQPPHCLFYTQRTVEWQVALYWGLL